MFVVIEGLDGAGKSTQVRKLKEYLISLFGEVEYIHFPRYDAPVYGGLISSFLKGDFGKMKDVHPQLVALLFAEDRHAALPFMRNVLEEGGTILLDRYVYSNIAYQCAKLSDVKDRDNLRNWIINTEYQDFNLPLPDINLFLDVPISFVESKLKDNRCGEDRSYLEGGKDIHEADIDFQRRVRDMYLQQLDLDKKFIRIDCADSKGHMMNPDMIFSKIKKEIDLVINKI